MVWYASIYIAPLNSREPTQALLVRLVSRKQASFKKLMVEGDSKWKKGQQPKRI